MKNSELLATDDQQLRLIDRQRRQVLMRLAQKNACPGCAYRLDYFDAADVDIDDWQGDANVADCHCTNCRRELVYTVPLIAGTGSGG
jgi:hypothetical protein